MVESRKKFLKKMIIGTGAIPFIVSSCASDDPIEPDTPDGPGGDGPGGPGGGGPGGGGTPGGSDSGNDTCSLAPSETEGPFPTKSPSAYERVDIREDRKGVEMSVSIQINTQSSNCTPLSGAIVDIWHCDADGNYSEYGGIQMQQTDYTKVHFLRGRQVTDSNGKVSFTTIFPGWYQSRATHIHVHIYDAKGNSLKVTQISFPEGEGNSVSEVNGENGQAYGYTKGLDGYTYNSADNVFSDDSNNVQMANVSGSLSEGFKLTHIINV